eukprot:3726774-Prymnesium_polylepis.1
MAGTSGSGLCGMQVWAHGSAVPHVCGGCRTAGVNGELHRAAGVSTCLTAIRSWSTCKQPAYSYLTPHKP